jgi:B12 binding protein
MRILLISSNRHDRFAGSLPIRPTPLGLAILLGALRETRHVVHFLDLMFVRTPQPAIRTAIRETSPDLIGISVQNLDAIGGRRIPAQRIRSFLLDIRMWIDTCRQESQAPIVLGGPAVSLLPREAFALWEPDFILAGDASRTFPELADRLERGDSYKDLPGLVRRASGEIRANTPGPWEAPRIAPRYEALDLPKYEAAGYGVAVLTKAWPYIRRDAPTSMSALGGPIPRPIPDLLADLRELQTRFGIRKVFLADSGFNVPLEEAKTVCRALCDSRVTLEWATGLQPGCMDRNWPL